MVRSLLYSVAHLANGTRTKSLLRLGSVSTILLAVCFSQAQNGGDRRIIVGTTLSTPPVLDGVIGPDEWPVAARGSGFFTSDTEDPSPTPAEFWIAYDKEYLYFAARITCDPTKIIREEYRQNVSLSSNDSIRLAIDVAGSLQAFDNFAFNASGATQVSLAGGRANKMEWAGSFDARARITETGWEGESRIPWRLIAGGYKGRHDLRFNVGWTCTKTSREYLWQVHRGNLQKLGIWKDVALDVEPEHRQLLLLPYGYAGVNRDGGIFNAGLDMKTAINGSVNAVATFNPDFRNIENEILSLDFSYLERLQAEARPFFLEGTNYFFTGFDQRLFTSQRIRDFDFGIKSYGRLGDRTTFGYLSTWDFGKSNANVATADYKINDTTSAQGAYVGYDAPGKRNQGGRLSIDHRIGTYDLYGIYMQTDDAQAGKGNNKRIGMSRNSGRYQTFFEYAHVTPDFFPRIGFAPESGFAGFYAGSEYETFLKRSPTIEAMGFFVFFQNYDRLNGDPYRRDFEAAAGFALRNRLNVRFALSHNRFEQFNDHFYSFSAEYPRNDRYRRFEFRAVTGRAQDLPYSSLSAELHYRPLRALQVSGGFQYVNHGGPDTQFILSANYDMSKLESIGGRLATFNGDTNWYLAFRRSGGNGNEYFLIIGDPNATTFKSQIILKGVFPIKVRY